LFFFHLSSGFLSFLSLSHLSFSLSPFFLSLTFLSLSHLSFSPTKMSRHFVVSCLSTVPILSPSSAPSQGFKAHVCQGPIGRSQSQILGRQTGPAAKQPSGFALPRTLYQSIPSISLPKGHGHVLPIITCWSVTPTPSEWNRYRVLSCPSHVVFSTR